MYSRAGLGGGNRLFASRGQDVVHFRVVVLFCIFVFLRGEMVVFKTALRTGLAPLLTELWLFLCF